MTKEECIKKIDEKIETLQVPFVKLKEFSYLKDIIKENPFRNIEEFKKIEIWDFVIAILYADKEDQYTIEEVKEKIKPLREFHESMSIENLAIFYDEILDRMRDKEKFEETRQELLENKFMLNLQSKRKEKRKSLEKEIEFALSMNQDVDRKQEDIGFEREKNAYLILFDLIDSHGETFMENLMDGIMNYFFALFQEVN